MIENPTEEELRTLKGIVYLIENKINNKKYVGISINPFFIRYHSGQWWNHIDNNYLYRSIEKYGKENFTISIIDYDISDEHLLNFIEVFFISVYNCVYPNGYNFETGGSKNKKMNEFSKIKSSKSHEKRTNKEYTLIDKDGNIYKFNNLRKFCREKKLCRMALRYVFTGRCRHTQGFHLPETDLRIRKNTTIRFFKDPNNNIYKVYNLANFCRMFNLTRAAIREVSRGNRRHHKKYILCDKEEIKNSNYIVIS